MMIGLYVVGFIYVFWIIFIVYAGATNNWDKLGKVQKGLLLPLGAVFGAIDVTTNFTLGTLVFLQWPSFAHITLTRRMHFNRSLGGWRAELAGWICNNMLDPFQSGHC